MIVYEDGIDGDITGLLEEQGAAGYTKVYQVEGRGDTSGPKLGTPIWPGFNNLLFVAVEEEVVEPLTQALRELQASYRKRPGLKIFAWPMEVF